MPTRTLPPRPSLDQLKVQAKELQRAHRDRDPSAAARIAAHNPKKGRPPEAVLDKRLALADAQLVIARFEIRARVPYGYFSGAMLLHHVAGNPGRDKPLPPNIGSVNLPATTLSTTAFWEGTRP